jgi:hypothetical protein
VRALAWIVAGLLLPQAAQAHAPLARGAVITTLGSAIVRAPGFGIVFRSPTGELSYACDALLGLDTDDQSTVFAARDDGSFLLGGTNQSLRVVAAGGCVSIGPNGWPATVGVSALTRASDSTDVYFAVSAEAAPGLYRSDNGGANWQLQSRFENGAAISGMRVVQPASGAAHVYVTRSAGAQQSQLLASMDDGATFSGVTHATDFTLIEARPGVPDQLWLLSPHPESGDVAIQRGSSSSTVFETVHRVRFFGGIAIDHTTDAVWIADEAGGLVRSINGGDRFETVDTTLAISCLTLTAGRLWACSTGTNQERALAVSDDRGETFTDVFAFEQVEQLAVCQSPIDAEAVCAAAWSEWRRDVLDLQAADASIDAGLESDAGTPTKRSASCEAAVGTRGDRGWIGFALLACWFGRRRYGALIVSAPR